MLKRIIGVSLASTVIPLTFILGSAFSVRGLTSWPEWAYFVWPSMIMLLPFGGLGNDLGFDFYVVSFLSLLVNAVIWCLVLLPLWALATKAATFRQ